MFSRDFRADFETVTGWLAPGRDDPPRCLVRYADGESAILRDAPFVAQSDKWQWQPGRGGCFAEMLRDSLALDLPGWYLGITCRQCHARDHEYLMGLARVSLDRITFAELFCFANFMEFQHLDLSTCWVVGPHASDKFGKQGLTFPELAMQDLARDRGIHVLARALWWMLHVPTGPILLSCGPAAKILAANYWKATSGIGFKRQTVLDVGSAMGWKLHERLTRHYQRQRSHLAALVPTW